MTKGSQTKAQILTQSAMLASTVGLQGLTIGGLAKAVGMSKSGLFAHFSSKENLQLMVLKLAAENFAKRVQIPAFKNHSRGEPRVRALFENWVNYLTDSSSLPGGNILIQGAIELNHQEGPLRDFVWKAQKALFEDFKKAAEFAKQEGHFRSDLDVEQFTWKVYSTVLGYHHFQGMLESDQALNLLKQNFEELLQDARRK